MQDTYSFVLAHGCRDSVSSVPSVGIVSTVIPFSAHLSFASCQEAAGCRTVITGAGDRLTWGVSVVAATAGRTVGASVSVVTGTAGMAVVSAVVGIAVVVVGGGGWTG